MARRICRVVAVGDAIVDRITPPMRPLPRGDFQGHIAAFETLPGGNATNFALQIARLGAKTTFVGVLGRDANAHLLREAYRMALPFVDTFFGNEVEVSALGGDRSPFEAARRICAMGAREVVIHRGDRGSAWISPDGIEKVPAFSVPIENPTGCGDVFNAAYVNARFGGDSVTEALRFANACSALHIRDRRHPYSRLSDVRRFLASRFTGS